MSYIMTYDIVCWTYDIVKTYDIVGFYPIVANRTYDIVYDVVYDVVRQTYNIVYNIIKTYDIVGFYPIVANRTLRCRIRCRTSPYDIVYDVPCIICIIRCRTSISYATSVLYDVVRRYRLKRTTKPYDVACDLATYDMPYDLACLSFLAQWALATDT